MFDIATYTTPAGLFQFKPGSNDLSQHQMRELKRFNELCRELQTRWPESATMSVGTRNHYEQFLASRTFLQNYKKSSTINVRRTTYGLKHDVEATTVFYVGQGSLALAALDLGFDLQLTDDGSTFHLNITMDDGVPWRSKSAFALRNT